MPIVLKDIPGAPLSPDDVSALANQEFDFADENRVSIREAKRKVKQASDDKHARNSILELNRVFGTNINVPDIGFYPGELRQGYGDFTFKEKAFEVAKATHRGLGQIVKLPGVALEAIGESAPTRQEIANFRDSDLF